MRDSGFVEGLSVGGFADIFLPLRSFSRYWKGPPGLQMAIPPVPFSLLCKFPTFWGSNFGQLPKEQQGSGSGSCGDMRGFSPSDALSGK